MNDRPKRLFSPRGGAGWYRCNFELTEVAAKRLFEGGEWSGRKFRQLVAKLGDEMGLGLDSRIFNYQDGVPMTGLPGVRFLSYKRGVALVGLGDFGVEMARSHAPKILSALIARCGCLIKVNERAGDVSYSPLPFPKRYFIPQLLPGSAKHMGKWMELLRQSEALGVPLWDLPQARVEIAHTIEISLRRQQNLHDPATNLELATADGGDNQPPTRHWQRPRTQWALLQNEEDELEMVLRGSRPFKVSVHGAIGRFFAPAANALKQELSRANLKAGEKLKVLPVLGLKGVEVSINAQFDGLWQVGFLNSHGFGEILESDAKSRQFDTAAAADKGGAQ